MAFFEVEEVEQVLKKVVELFLVPRFKELGMPATGEWEQNLEVVAESNGGKIRGRDYSQQLAFGRKPGKRPPVAPLQKWVMAKFGKGSKEALGIAYAISKKIENEGTTWYQKGGSTLLEILEEPRVIEFIQSELSVIATVRVAEQLRRNAEQTF